MHPRALAAVNDGHMAESLQNSLDSHVFGYLPNTKPVPAEINRSPVLNLMKAKTSPCSLGLCQKNGAETRCHKTFSPVLPSSH